MQRHQGPGAAGLQVPLPGAPQGTWGGRDLLPEQEALDWGCSDVAAPATKSLMQVNSVPSLTGRESRWFVWAPSVPSQRWAGVVGQDLRHCAVSQGSSAACSCLGRGDRGPCVCFLEGS